MVCKEHYVGTATRKGVCAPSQHEPERVSEPERDAQIPRFREGTAGNAKGLDATAIAPLQQ